jgi:hypothetical protein
VTPDDVSPAPDEPELGGSVVVVAVVVGANVVVGAGVVAAVVVGVGVVADVVVGVVEEVVVGAVVVVAGGDACAWAGAVIELIIGFVQMPGRMSAVATPPMRTVRTCLRSWRFNCIEGNSRKPVSASCILGSY